MDIVVNPGIAIIYGAIYKKAESLPAREYFFHPAKG